MSSSIVIPVVLFPFLCNISIMGVAEQTCNSILSSSKEAEVTQAFRFVLPFLMDRGVRFQDLSEKKRVLFFLLHRKI